MNRPVLWFMCGLICQFGPAAMGATLGPLPTSTPIPLTAADWTSSMSFPQFDSSLGTLNSVRLLLPANFNTTIVIECVSPGSANGNSVMTVEYLLQDSANSFPGDGLSVAFSQSPPIVNYTLSQGQSISADRTGTFIGGGLFSSPEILNAFTGTGEIDFSVSLKAYLLIANHGADVVSTSVTSAALTGTVTYDFEPIPEPSSYLLGALALVGLLSFRRCKDRCRDKLGGEKSAANGEPLGKCAGSRPLRN